MRIRGIIVLGKICLYLSAVSENVVPPWILVITSSMSLSKPGISIPLAASFIAVVNVIPERSIIEILLRNSA